MRAHWASRQCPCEEGDARQEDRIGSQEVLMMLGTPRPLKIRDQKWYLINLGKTFRAFYLPFICLRGLPASGEERGGDLWNTHLGRVSAPLLPLLPLPLSSGSSLIRSVPLQQPAAPGAFHRLLRCPPPSPLVPFWRILTHWLGIFCFWFAGRPLIFVTNMLKIPQKLPHCVNNMQRKLFLLIKSVIWPQPTHLTLILGSFCQHWLVGLGLGRWSCFGSECRTFVFIGLSGSECLCYSWFVLLQILLHLC